MPCLIGLGIKKTGDFLSLTRYMMFRSRVIAGYSRNKYTIIVIFQYLSYRMKCGTDGNLSPGGE